MNEEVKELINSVLVWWEEHQYDTTSNEEDEYNVYDEEPEFVKIAKRLKEVDKVETQRENLMEIINRHNANEWDRKNCPEVSQSVDAFIEWILEEYNVTRKP